MRYYFLITNFYSIFFSLVSYTGFEGVAMSKMFAERNKCETISACTALNGIGSGRKLCKYPQSVNLWNFIFIVHKFRYTDTDTHLNLLFRRNALCSVLFSLDYLLLCFLFVFFLFDSAVSAELFRCISFIPVNGIPALSFYIELNGTNYSLALHVH